MTHVCLWTPKPLLNLHHCWSQYCHLPCVFLLATRLWIMSLLLAQKTVCTIKQRLGLWKYILNQCFAKDRFTREAETKSYAFSLRVSPEKGSQMLPCKLFWYWSCFALVRIEVKTGMLLNCCPWTFINKVKANFTFFALNTDRHF